MAGCELPQGSYRVLQLQQAGQSVEGGAMHKSQWILAVPEPASASSLAYLALKGTSNTVDVLLDACVADIVTAMGARVHAGSYVGIQSELAGMMEVIATAAQDLPQLRTVVFCGHSLGGALAMVAAVELCADPRWPAALSGRCVTFGAPFVFGSAVPGGPLELPPGLRAPPRMTHLVHNFDLVPRVLNLPREAINRFCHEAAASMIEQKVEREIPILGAVVGKRIVQELRTLVSLLTERLDPLRTFRACGDFVFLVSAMCRPNVGQRSEDLCGTARWGPARRTAATAVPAELSEDGVPYNTAAEDLLRFMPGLCRLSPCADIHAAEASASAAWCMKDHALHAYLAAIRHLLHVGSDWAAAAVPQPPPPSPGAQGRARAAQRAAAVREALALLRAHAEDAAVAASLRELQGGAGEPPEGPPPRQRSMPPPLRWAWERSDPDAGAEGAASARTPPASPPLQPSDAGAGGHPAVLARTLEPVNVAVSGVRFHLPRDVQPGETHVVERAVAGTEVRLRLASHGQFSVTFPRPAGVVAVDASPWLGAVAWDSLPVERAARGEGRPEGAVRDLRPLHPAHGESAAGPLCPCGPPDSVCFNLHRLSRHQQAAAARLPHISLWVDTRPYSPAVEAAGAALCLLLVSAAERPVLRDSFNCRSDSGAQGLARRAALAAGQNAAGQLGLGHQNRQKFFARIPDLRGLPLAEVCCAEHCTLVRAFNGQLFGCGQNSRGTLGLGHRDAVPTFVHIPLPRDERTVRLACGQAHTVVVTDQLELLCCGRNDHGALGLGHTQDVSEFRSPCVPAGRIFARVCCGASFTAVLTTCGEVWGAGSGDGALGQGDADQRRGFVRVPVPDACRGVEAMSASRSELFLLTREGKVFVCGQNKSGLLGLGHTRPQLVVTAMPLPGEHRVIQVACGLRHVLLRCHDGTLLAAGGGSCGALGLGETQDRHKAVVVADLRARGKVTHVACGCDFSFAVCDDGHTLAAGVNRYYNLGITKAEGVLRFTPVASLEALDTHCYPSRFGPNTFVLCHVPASSTPPAAPSTPPAMASDTGSDADDLESAASAAPAAVTPRGTPSPAPLAVSPTAAGAAVGAAQPPAAAMAAAGAAPSPAAMAAAAVAQHPAQQHAAVGAQQQQQMLQQQMQQLQQLMAAKMLEICQQMPQHAAQGGATQAAPAGPPQIDPQLLAQFVQLQRSMQQR
eukprot:TRINITY_DN49_c0_g1_i3.p1 TRINITY_DN49_c0_g1~~TRINITY_DN49_c0_g1_i3.p1  ORF type:complete len:1393 (+),score=379.37 TRINITY_DN49_c0_g1_i3:596-4180(+)